jgi:hypothetical protein
MKVRYFPVIAALAALLVIAGCGGSSSSGDPAKVAPADAPVFIEASLQPQGSVKEDVDSLAQKIAGVDDLGQLIVSEAEKAASDSDEPLDFEKEIQPWLGEQAGMYLENYDGNEFHGYGVAIEATDSGAAEEFVEDQAKSQAEGAPKEGSFEGVDYFVNPTSEENVVGVFDGFLVIAENVDSFKAMVSASKGKSLAESSSYEDATTSTPSDSIASVYVDIGGLIKQSGGAIDPQAKQFLDTVGIKPEAATALATVIPGSDQIEVDVSSDLNGQKPSSGDASKLLGELPASSVAAISSPEFGDRFGEAINQLDEKGIPGQIPPHELKKAMKAAGIDLEKISGSVGNLGVFAEGSSESNLGGAAILEVKSATEAKNTVANAGFLLRASHTPGFTVLSGKFAGFSVHNSDLGPKPLIVAAVGERIAVAYGLPAATKALESGGAQLSGDATYKEAVSSLGGTPISGFVDGPAALRLASALVPADKKEGYDKAKPYLSKIDYIAIGGGASGERSTAKLIISVGK